MKRIHSPMTVHRPSLVSRKARARGACRLRHRDDSTYTPSGSKASLMALLPLANSLQVPIVARKSPDASEGAAGEGVEPGIIAPIGVGVAGAVIIGVALYLVNAIAKLQATRAMMDTAMDRFPQISEDVASALKDYRMREAIDTELPSEVRDPKSWPLPGLSRGFVTLARDLSDIIDADMESQGLLGRVGPTVLLSNYGLSELVVGRHGRMRLAAQLAHGESEGFGAVQKKHLDEIFFGTPFKSFSAGIGENDLVLGKLVREHETVARAKPVSGSARTSELDLARGAHLIAAAMMLRRRGRLLDSHADRTDDFARARRNLDEAQRLFDTARDAHPEWFKRDCSSVGRLGMHLNALKKAAQFDMITSDMPPPPSRIGSWDGRPQGPDDTQPPTAAFMGLGASQAFFQSRPIFQPL